MNTAARPFMVSLEDMRLALENASTLVIDIREPYEHANGVASGAVLMPMSQLGSRLAELPEPGGKPFWLICNTQMRSANVVGQLQNMGYTNASYVDGGMSLWARQAWPMVKP
jgi:rhodanese-related sulfurtransferase